MTPQERLALALQYQKQRQELGSTLPDMNRAPTDAEPEQSWLDKLSEAASGAGYGLASQVEGIGQMVRHPLDTLHSMAVGAGKAMDNPAAAGTAVVQGLKEAANQAVSSPFNMGRAVGANINVNPRKLAAMLESPMVTEMTVYHGTPHQFSATEANPLGEFDASKIGTGEGAQAYGHGIYVAENPDVAKGYKTANELTQTVVEGKVIDFSDPRYQAAVRISKDGYQNALNKAIEESKNDFLTPEGKQKRMLLAEQIKALKGKKIGAETTGALYTVDLPDEHIERMLDYDKPLKDQPAAYQAIRSTIPADVVKDFDANVEKGITGGNAYSNWVWGGKTPAGSSEKLRQLGIVGIKYLDAGSRGQGGSGTRNFVIFPGEEKNLKILERK